MTDNLNRIRLGIIGVWVIITIVTYIFVFGDSGYLVRKNLESKIEDVRFQIRDLKTENDRLNEKYLSVTKNSESLSENSLQESSETIILKLKNVEDSASIAENDDAELTQTRIIFVTLSTFLAVLFVFLAGILHDNLTRRRLVDRGPNISKIENLES
jgi:hypothetical protein